MDTPTPRPVEAIPRHLRFSPIEDDITDAKLDALVDIARARGWRAALDEVYGDDDIVGYVTDPDRAAFLDLLPLGPSTRALEIGAGLGQITTALARRVASVDALEVVPKQAEFAAERCRQEGLANVSLAIGGDDCRLPYEAGKFDVVVLNLVLEWCGNRCVDEPHAASQRRLLAEIHRVLAPGGTLWIATKNRFALGYLLGQPDEHSFGQRFASVVPRSIARVLLELRGHTRAAGLLHSHDGLAAMLREAGFTTTQSLWAAPEMRYPTHFVRNDARAIRKARREAGFVQGDRRATRWPMRFVPAPLVKHVTPGLAFVATRG
jgi:SAM-dependent methyltransferase